MNTADITQDEDITSESINRSTWFTLALLTGAAFMYVTFEMFPVGLITEIACNLRVSESKIGFMISGYAVVTGIVTIPSIWLVRGISRKTSLLISLVTLIFAQIMTVVAVNYPLFAVSRIIAALTHGILWSLLAPIAASLVPKEKNGTATACVQSGATIAIIVGSPATTILGSYIGWHQSAILLVTVTFAITIGIAKKLPHDEHKGTPTQEFPLPDFRVAWKTVYIICLITIVFVLAHFISFTYFEVIVDTLSSDHQLVSVFMTIFGITGAISIYIISRINDKHPKNSTIISISVFAVGIAFIPLAFDCGHSFIADLILALAISAWGAGYAALAPCYQTSIMRVSHQKEEFCSALFVTSYQIGIASGAAIGGMILPHSLRLIPLISTIIASFAALMTIYWRKIFLQPRQLQ